MWIWSLWLAVILNQFHCWLNINLKLYFYWGRLKYLNMKMTLSLEMAETIMQQKVRSLSTWTATCGLEIILEMRAILCLNRRRIRFISKILSNTNSISFVTKHRYLDLYLDEPFLTWKYKTEYLITPYLYHIDYGYNVEDFEYTISIQVYNREFLIQ